MSARRNLLKSLTSVAAAAVFALGMLLTGCTADLLTGTDLDAAASESATGIRPPGGDHNDDCSVDPCDNDHK
jgi:hypothetical protein